MQETEEGILIKNIVFDIAGVLLDYSPREYLQRYVDTVEEAELLAHRTFLSDDWEELDRGLFDRREIINRICEKYPEDAGTIRRAVSNWTEMMEPLEENTRLVPKLKQSGYPLYLLSNYPRQGYEEVSEKFDFFRHFKGEVISGDVAYLKPEDEIYQVLIEKFSLEPQHTVFIDDGQENVEAAEENGLVGIHYDGEIDLAQKLRELNVNI